MNLNAMQKMRKPFEPNFKLGILGGGQLGRMLIQQAINYNLDVAILDSDPNAPCSSITPYFTAGKLTDYETVLEFGQDCDVITIEIENVNTAALKELEKQGKKVYPQPHIIEMIQDKRLQKQFYKDNDIPTSDFILTENKDDVAQNADRLPAVNKLGTEGYDGRGVQILRSENDLHKAFDKPGLLEALVDIEKEISIVIARNEKGETKAFPAVELVYHPEQNMVDYLISPAHISEEEREEAIAIATELINKMEMVGLLAVEMFIDEAGDVLVNEIAPRPHNSGHQSIEGNISSQYDQHLRSILNLPLAATDVKIESAMVNLLGEDGHSGMAKYEGIEDVLKLSGTHVHLYGKKETRPFRKMGHITITDNDRHELIEKVKFIKENFKIKAWDNQ